MGGLTFENPLINAVCEVRVNLLVLLELDALGDQLGVHALYKAHILTLSR